MTPKVPSILSCNEALDPRAEEVRVWACEAWEALGGAPWSWSGVKREWARPPSCGRFVMG